MTDLPAYTLGMAQTAVYWPPLARGGTGERAFGPPVAAACRWQDDAVLFMNAQGEQVTSSAVVYVDRVLELGGYLALVALADANVDPTTTPGAREVRQRAKSPSLLGDQQLNKVYL